MNGSNSNQSEPDYDGWKTGICEVAALKDSRFHFVITVMALVAITCASIYFGEWIASCFAMILLIVFCAAVLIAQWHRDDDGRKPKM